MFLFHIILTPNSSYPASLDSLWFPKHTLPLFASVGFLYLRCPTPSLAIENLSTLKAKLRTISPMKPHLTPCGLSHLLATWGVCLLCHDLPPGIYLMLYNSQNILHTKSLPLQQSVIIILQINKNRLVRGTVTNQGS